MFARVENDCVVEVVLPLDGLSLVEMFHPDLLSQFVPCGDQVQPGWVLVDGEFAPPPALPMNLSALKVALKSQIDEAAERERLKYITPGSGQALEYQQAAAEATILLAAIASDPQHEPDPDDYPMLMASIGLDGETLMVVATTVATMHRQWQAVGSAIRSARLAAKKAIDEAPDEAAARAVQPVWPEA
jgi:hypothetical protein